MDSLRKELGLTTLWLTQTEINAALKIGAEKARKIAREVLDRTRSKVGY